MKFSMILASVLPALGLANPATMPRAASEEPRDIADIILGNLKLSAIPMDKIEALHTCLSEHKTFRADFDSADDGFVSISQVDRACCDTVLEILDQLPRGAFGVIRIGHFCDPITATGAPKAGIALLRSFFDSIP